MHVDVDLGRREPSELPDSASSATERPASSPGRGRAVAITVVGLVVVGIGLTAVLGGSPDPASPVPTAPTSAVEIAWTLPYDDIDRRADVLDIGDGLLVVDQTVDGGRLRKVDPVTGAVSWAHASTLDEVVAVVDAERAEFVESTDLAAPILTRLVGRSWVDGAEQWVRTVDATFSGSALPDGRLLVAGNGNCGFLSPSDGHIQVLEQADACRPRGDDLVVVDSGEVELRDEHGLVEATVEGSEIDPVLVDDLVVEANGQMVTGTTVDGEERWATPIERPVHGLEPWQDTMVVVTTATRDLLVDREGQTITVLDPSYDQPILLGERVRVVSNGINRVLLLDPEGTVIAATEGDARTRIADLHATADGALALVDDTLGSGAELQLLGYPDLDVRWRTDLGDFVIRRIRLTTPELVVLEVLDPERAGGFTLVGLRPEDGG